MLSLASSTLLHDLVLDMVPDHSVSTITWKLGLIPLRAAGDLGGVFLVLVGLVGVDAELVPLGDAFSSLGKGALATGNT